MMVYMINPSRSLCALILTMCMRRRKKKDYSYNKYSRKPNDDAPF